MGQENTQNRAGVPAGAGKGQQTETSDTPEKKPPKMTKAEAASYVRRQVAKRDGRGQVVKDKEGKPVVESQPIKADEVMAFKDYGNRVVVVTTSGEKLSGEKRK